MALVTGNLACTTGLSQRIYDALVALPSAGFSSPMTAAQEDAVKAICWAIAFGVVEEIQTNGESRITISTSDAGLQRDPASSDDCLAPSTDKPLVGTIA